MPWHSLVLPISGRFQKFQPKTKLAAKKRKHQPYTKPTAFSAQQSPKLQPSSLEGVVRKADVPLCCSLKLEGKPGFDVAMCWVDMGAMGWNGRLELEVPEVPPQKPATPLA